MGFFSVIISDIRSRRNLEDYVAILFGLALSVLGVLGVVRFEILAAGILIVISSAIWSSLENRHEITDLKGLIQKSRLPNQILRFAEFPEAGIGEQVRQAKELCLSGVSLFRFFPMYYVDIKEALRKGATLKVVIADPDSAAVEMASFRSDDGLSPEMERQRISEVLDFIKQQMSKRPTPNLEVRICPYLVPYSIVILTPFDSKAKPYCHARLFPFRTSPQRAPLITPDPQTDEAWFHFFLSNSKIYGAPRQGSLSQIPLVIA